MPAAGLFIASALTEDNAIDGSHLLFCSELLAFGFVAMFIALLWVASERLPLPKRPAHRRFPPPKSYGFEVLPRNRGDEKRLDL